jgi:hypothetical protein
MAFMLGIVLFVVVAGLVDRRLPWPSAKNHEVAPW